MVYEKNRILISLRDKHNLSYLRTIVKHARIKQSFITYLIDREMAAKYLELI